jgi:hypothetical protein
VRIRDGHRGERSLRRHCAGGFELNLNQGAKRNFFAR